MYFHIMTYHHNPIINIIQTYQMHQIHFTNAKFEKYHQWMIMPINHISLHKNSTTRTHNINLCEHFATLLPLIMTKKSIQNPWNAHFSR